MVCGGPADTRGRTGDDNDFIKVLSRAFLAPRRKTSPAHPWLCVISRAGRFDPGVAMVGIATAFAFEPKLPERWKVSKALDINIPNIGWRNKEAATGRL